MSCSEFHHRLHQRLDGERFAGEHGPDPHLAQCPQCRSLQAAAGRLEEGLRVLAPAEPPAGLGARIVAGVLAERKSQARLRYRRLTAAALAAGLLLAVGLGYRWWQLTQTPRSIDSGGLVQEKPAPVRPPAPPSLDQNVEEVGSALASLWGRTTNQALGQGRALLPAKVEMPPLPKSGTLQASLEPSGPALQKVGENVSAVLEPVGTSGRRALNLFIQDLAGL